MRAISSIFSSWAKNRPSLEKRGGTRKSLQITRAKLGVLRRRVKSKKGSIQVKERVSKSNVRTTDLRPSMISARTATRHTTIYLKGGISCIGRRSPQKAFNSPKRVHSFYLFLQIIVEKAEDSFGSKLTFPSSTETFETQATQTGVLVCEPHEGS